MKKPTLSALLLLSLATPALAQESIVVNGSFENPFVSRGTWNAFISIPGWSTISGSSIEIQAWDAQEGSQVVELDSYFASTMEQRLTTKPGQGYTLTFAFSPRPGLADNRIGVYWQGTLLQIVNADGSSNSANVWTTYTFSVKASLTSTSLRFADLSVSDSVGGLLDNVRVVEQAAEANRCGKQGAGHFIPAGNTPALYQQHSATALPDGQVVVTGGYGPNSALFNPTTRTWAASGSTLTTRRLHTATDLGGGRVLVVGGDDSGASGTAEVYDAASGGWTPTSAPLAHRREHSAIRLADGRVLVAGGTDDAGQVLDTAELYDPASRTWKATGRMSQPRRAFTVTELADGRILAVGGLADGGDECLESNCRGSAELYDAKTGTWKPTGSLATARGFHAATRLGTGQVLVSGGSMDGTTSFRAELYTPATGTWSSTGTMLSPRRRHTLTTLSDANWVLSAGGYDALTGTLSSAELYDANTGTWCATGSMNQPRFNHTATPLAGGQVLITTGVSTNAANQYTTEVFDPGVQELPRLTR